MFENRKHIPQPTDTKLSINAEKPTLTFHSLDFKDANGQIHRMHMHVVSSDFSADSIVRLYKTEPSHEEGFSNVTEIGHDRVSAPKTTFFQACEAMAHFEQTCAEQGFTIVKKLPVTKDDKIVYPVNGTSNYYEIGLVAINHYVDRETGTLHNFSDEQEGSVKIPTWIVNLEEEDRTRIASLLRQYSTAITDIFGSFAQDSVPLSTADFLNRIESSTKDIKNMETVLEIANSVQETVEGITKIMKDFVATLTQAQITDAQTVEAIRLTAQKMYDIFTGSFTKTLSQLEEYQDENPQSAYIYDLHLIISLAGLYGHVTSAKLLAYGLHKTENPEIKNAWGFSEAREYPRGDVKTMFEQTVNAVKDSIAQIVELQVGSKAIKSEQAQQTLSTTTDRMMSYIQSPVVPMPHTEIAILTTDRIARLKTIAADLAWKIPEPEKTPPVKKKSASYSKDDWHTYRQVMRNPY